MFVRTKISGKFILLLGLIRDRILSMLLMDLFGMNSILVLAALLQERLVVGRELIL